jgi:hypothetical protein
MTRKLSRAVRRGGVGKVPVKVTRWLLTLRLVRCEVELQGVIRERFEPRVIPCFDPIHPRDGATVENSKTKSMGSNAPFDKEARLSALL